MTGWTNESLDACLSGRMCAGRDGLIIMRPKKEVPWMQLMMALGLTSFLPNRLFLCFPPALVCQPKALVAIQVYDVRGCQFKQRCEQYGWTTGGELGEMRWKGGILTA